METVQIKCTDNNKVMTATLVSKNDTMLVAFWKEADTKLTMKWNGRVYVTSKMGYEFTCDGVVTNVR